MFATLQRLLENPISRIVLSAAIVISLVPHDWLSENDAWFLLFFGPEVAARALLAFRRESLPVAAGRKLETGWRAPTSTELWLLALDFIAVLSFVPFVASSLMSARWLRLFRLSRTVLLLRYWAPVVNDLWMVSRRPERLRQIVFIFGSLIIICFAGAVMLEHLTSEVGDDFDGDGVVGDEHDHDFFVRMWWAFRQVEDPGNLLASPHDAGTLVVSVALTMAGLFVISFIIGVGTDVVTDLSALGRMRPPGLRGHTVIVNATPHSRRLLEELLHEETKLLPGSTEGGSWLGRLWRNLRRSKAFVVVGRTGEAPEFLQEQEFSSVVYRAWEDGDDDTLLSRGDILLARRVVLLADDEDAQPDDDTVRTMLSIVEQMRECDDDDPRRLLSEIVTLDHLPAAERASSRARAPLACSLVPTESLIAHSVAAVCRRQGLAGLLITLLRSEGREIYAWEQGSGRGDASLHAIGGAAPLESLATAGEALEASSQSGVTPVGVIVEDAEQRRRVVLNPRAEQLAGTVRGVVGIADNQSRIAELVGQQGASAPAQPSARAELQFEVEPALAVKQALVCGFRPATVHLLEALLRDAEADAEVHLLLADEEALATARHEFAAQGAMVRQGLHPHAAGAFSDEGEFIRWTPLDEGNSVLDIQLTVADWTSPRTLGDLPGGVGSAVDFDLILFSADGSGESDARNTTGLMTIEALAAARGRDSLPRVVAEVDDVELAARLNTRYLQMGHPEVQVFSTDELRALVVFQSVVVTYFPAILEELVAPTGHGLVSLRAQPGAGTMGHAELAETLRAQGRVLVAVDARDRSEPRIGSSTAPVNLDEARLWVIES